MKTYNNIPIVLLVTLILIGAVTGVQADTIYPVDDENELLWVLANGSDQVKIIELQNNVLVGDTTTITVQGGDHVIFDLRTFNLQGNGAFTFAVSGGSHAEVTINGSSVAFDGGLKLSDDITLDYNGVYQSSSLDILGSSAGDNVILNLLTPDSGWDAFTSTPAFIGTLPANLDDKNAGGEYIIGAGTLVVGGLGYAEMHVASGNWVDNGETIVGAKNGSTGYLTIDGYGDRTMVGYSLKEMPTEWRGSGSFYVGFEGKGTVDITDRALLTIGSIGVGIKDTSEGELNVNGIGGQSINEHVMTLDPRTTTVHLFGRDDRVDVTTGNDYDNNNFSTEHSITLSGLVSNGEGVINVENGAHIIFDARDPYKNDTVTGTVESNVFVPFTPVLSLGNGNSTVTDSLISGAVLAQHSKNEKTEPHVYKVGEIRGRDYTTMGDSVLTFKKSVLEGSLKIAMTTNEFEDHSVITPGFSKYEQYYFIDDKDKIYYQEGKGTPYYTDSEDKLFGRLDFDNANLTLDTTVKTYIDFDVHGDKNANTGANEGAANHDWLGDDGSNPYVDTIKNNQNPDDAKFVHGGYTNNFSNGYLGDQGRDVVYSSGNITLSGTINFRPQSGYYSDDIEVDFLHTNFTGTDANGFLTSDGQLVTNTAFDDMVLEPKRWFTNPGIVYDYNSGGTTVLKMQRHQSPFTDAANSFNTAGVGGALDQIYNAQDNYSWLNVLDWLWLMDDKDFRIAMRQLSGETRAASFYMPVRSPWRFGFERVNWSRDSRSVYFGTQNSAAPKLAKWDLWVTPYYDYQHMHWDGNASAATTQRFSFVGGYDRALSRKSGLYNFSESAFGIVFGYSQPKLDQWGSRCLADDFLLGAHFDTRFDSQYEIKIWGGIGSQFYRLKRSIPIQLVPENYSARYSGMTYSLASQLARPFNFKNGTIRPFIGSAVNHVDQGAAEEQGYNQARLRFLGSAWTQFFGQAGIKADYAWSRCNLSASLSYSHLLLGDAMPVVRNQFVEAGGSSFEVGGANLGRSFVSFGLGTQFCVDKLKRSTMFMNYNSEYSERSNAHTFALGYQHVF